VRERALVAVQARALERALRWGRSPGGNSHARQTGVLRRGDELLAGAALRRVVAVEARQHLLDRPTIAGNFKQVGDSLWWCLSLQGSTTTKSAPSRRREVRFGAATAFGDRPAPNRRRCRRLRCRDRRRRELLLELPLHGAGLAGALLRAVLVGLEAAVDRVTVTRELHRARAVVSSVTALPRLVLGDSAADVVGEAKSSIGKP
jgi:hypothetical protein